MSPNVKGCCTCSQPNLVWHMAPCTHLKKTAADTGSETLSMTWSVFWFINLVHCFPLLQAVLEMNGQGPQRCAPHTQFPRAWNNKPISSLDQQNVMGEITDVKMTLKPKTWIGYRTNTSVEVAASLFNEMLPLSRSGASVPLATSSSMKSDRKMERPKGTPKGMFSNLSCTFQPLLSHSIFPWTQSCQYATTASECRNFKWRKSC